jgi:dGTPase
MTSKAQTVIREMFDAFLARPELLPAEHHQAAQLLESKAGDGGRARAVADYIAGMTDRYAIMEHERLFDPAKRS